LFSPFQCFGINLKIPGFSFGGCEMNVYFWAMGKFVIAVMSIGTHLHSKKTLHFFKTLKQNKL